MLWIVLLFLPTVKPEIFMDVHIQDQEAHERFIGFTAWAQQTIKYEGGEVIVFTGQLVNEGNHYSPVTGLFTCPSDGVYLVSVGLSSSFDNRIVIAVYNEGDILIDCDTSLANPFDTCTHSVITSCQSGDQIYMQSSDLGLVYGDSDRPRSTFTVMLLSHTDYVLHDDVIGFTVSKRETQKYDIEDVITYSKLFYNGGSGYSLGSNRFQCPVSGVYFIEVASWKSSSEPLHLSVMKADEEMFSTIENSTSNYASYTTNNGLFNCGANETVQVIASEQGSVYGSTTPVTTHSGFLLSPMQEDQVHGSVVGCTVYKQDVQEYNMTDVIIFDGILYDSGHYQRQLSRFVCPVAGVYYVTLNAKKSGTEPLSIYIEHPSNVTSAVFQLENFSTLNGGLMLSNSALITAEKDDVIQVKASDRGSVFGDSSVTHTTFTVMLMY